MRKIGFDLPLNTYFVTTTKFAAFILTCLALLPIAVIGAATALFGVAGTYCSLAFAVIYLVGLGWFAGEVVDNEYEEPQGELWR